MTVTTDSVRSALELAPEHDHVDSHLHPEGSFDVADHEVPTGREEIWRFTPLKRLKGLHADAEFMPSETTCTWNTHEGVRIEGVDVADEAVDARPLRPRPQHALGGAGDGRGRRRACSSTCPPTPRWPSRSSSTSTARTSASPRPATSRCASAAHSKAIVVLNHTGSSTIAAVVEIAVGDGADVTVVSIQDWADDAVHLSHHQARVGRDATYKHAAISFGGDLVRMDANVTYDGPGGSAELLGLYFADAGQHIEHRIFADHTAPRTKSHAVYKGALQGEKAHTVWVGNVLIRKVAEGIETYEENRNLVLTDGCRADSIPNLEIETGEIEGAGHASATARFDDTQLFYLQSRGISEKEAQRLVVHGFFNDLIRQVGVPSIEERLLTTVEAELAKNVLKDLGSLAAFGQDS